MDVLFLALPFLVVSLAALAVVAWVGFSFTNSQLSVYLLLAVLIAFSGSSYGQLEAARTIYSRGTGQLYFSFVNIFLWGIALVIALGNAFRYQRFETTPLAKYFWAITLLVLGNVVFAAAADDQSLQVLSVFSSRGLINIINMALFFYVCLNAFGTPKNARNLLRFLLLAIGLRGVFGIVRWAFFGGDPSNVYDNVERTGTKLTFFDVNDGFLATLAMFCSAWLMYFRKKYLTGWEQFFLVGLFLLEAAIIVLSFRRSSLISLGLASIMFIALLPPRQKLWATVVASVGLVGATTLLSMLRLSKVRGASGELGFFYDIFGGAGGAESSSRVLEYTETWRSLGDYWVFGTGMWGVMQTNLAALSYHAGDFGFVHSGFGHVLLKGGVFGLLVFIGMLISFAVHYVRARRSLQGELQLLADLGAAGVLFWLPSLLIGTPIIEFRSMLMLGLALALPFIATRAAAGKNHVVA